MKCPQCMHDNAPYQTHCQRCHSPLPASSGGISSTGIPSSDTDAIFRVGQVVNERYTVMGLVGKGGVGHIYKVRDNALNEVLALKTLLPQFTQDKAVVERFFNEARIARKLTHGNIVRVHDIGTTGANAYISMEFVEGATLRQVLDQRRASGNSISLKDVLYILDGLCCALEYAHKFTVHRDIKPDNIMIEKGGNIKLMDFGISKLVDNVQLTGVSMVMGTPYYMSPEQLRDSSDVDGRADIFSVGVVLYELLTGNRPTGIPKPASEMLKDVPPILDDIVAKCVEPDREQRYQSATALRHAIRPLLQAINEGKDLSREFRKKEEKTDSKPGWNLFGLGSKFDSDTDTPVTTPRSRMATPPSRPADDPVNIALDPAYRDLATLDEEPVSARYTPPPSQGFSFPDIGNKLFIGGAIIAGVVLLWLGGGYTLARIKDMRTPVVTVAPTAPNRALDMLAQGAAPFDAFKESLAALKRADSEENRSILTKTRDAFLNDVKSRATVIPYSAKTVNGASEDIALAAQLDSDPKISEMLKFLNDELSYYKFVLMSVDQAKGTATFILNNSKIKENEQTVSEGEYLQDRFLVKKIGPNFVSLQDPKVLSSVGNPRPLIARLLQPISDN